MSGRWSRSPGPVADADPSVTLTTPSHDLRPGDTATLVAQAADDFGVTLVTIYEGSRKLAEFDTPPYRTDAPIPADAGCGDRHYSAVAEDSAGQTSVSELAVPLCGNTPAGGGGQTPGGSTPGNTPGTRPGITGGHHKPGTGPRHRRPSRLTLRVTHRGRHARARGVLSTASGVRPAAACRGAVIVIYVVRDSKVLRVVRTHAHANCTYHVRLTLPRGRRIALRARFFGNRYLIHAAVTSKRFHA